MLGKLHASGEVGALSAGNRVSFFSIMFCSAEALTRHQDIHRPKCRRSSELDCFYAAHCKRGPLFCDISQSVLQSECSSHDLRVAQ